MTIATKTTAEGKLRWNRWRAKSSLSAKTSPSPYANPTRNYRLSPHRLGMRVRHALIIAVDNTRSE
jgi:hypothetical protein